METDPIRMVGAMFGIPGASVVDGEQVESGVRLVIETTQKSAACPSCGSRGMTDGKELSELGTFPAMGQPVTIHWRRRMWRCETPGCSIERFAEEDEGVTAFLARPPQIGRTSAKSDQSGLPA